MKYKSFQGADKAQVNEWLKGKKIRVHKSDQSIKTVSLPYTDVKGKQRARKVPYMTVNVWYEDEKSN
jgi:hypothetical protein